ncbi:MAG: hypothetical protein ABI883_05600 [Chthoniobacterales bacterium]
MLFLRWLLAIALVALGVADATSSRPKRPASTAYEIISLVQGGHSSGLPLAGITIDPINCDTFAVVGGLAADVPAAAKSLFFVVYKSDEGQTYATTFPRGESRPAALFEISPALDIRAVDSFGGLTAAEPHESAGLADAQKVLRSIVDALPETASVKKTILGSAGAPLSRREILGRG